MQQHRSSVTATLLDLRHHLVQGFRTNRPDTDDARFAEVCVESETKIKLNMHKINSMDPYAEKGVEGQKKQKQKQETSIYSLRKAQLYI